VKELERGGSETVAGALASFCVAQRSCSVYAVCGGGNGVLYAALCESGLPFVHCRREDACVYAAIEASLASGRPAVVCVTSGEAVSNAMSAIASARSEGASLLVLSAFSNPEQFGRPAIQATDLESMPSHFYTTGPLFDCARVVLHTDELPWLMARLSVGFQRPTGFVAHLAVPRSLQRAEFRFAELADVRLALPAPAPSALDYCATAFREDSFAVVVGFGARRHAAAVRDFLALTKADAFTTPRGKGIVPVPCIGLGGVSEYYPRGRPARLLVLGSRLGEASCGWDEALLPSHEIVHVDLDPGCFGLGYRFRTYGIQAELGLFLHALVAELGARNNGRRPTEAR
jgi:acetolactate synthase-1/2/3 large subunit